MESKNTEAGFSYTYSAIEQEEIRKIREKYQHKEEDDMNRLRKLDAKVTQKATVNSLIAGVVGALIMGAGMSLVMTDIGTTVGISDPMLPGIVIGIAGMFMAIINYPIYKGILGVRRKKYADKIIALSDKIMKG